jgi:DME family drug/metabolite transporter
MRIENALRAREGLLAVSAGAVLWGTNGVLVKFVSGHSSLSSVSIGFYRLVFSSIVLLLIAGWSSLQVWRRSPWPSRGLLALSGILLGAYQALYFAAIGNVGVSVSTLVSLAVAPLAITIVQAARRRRWPSMRAVSVLSLALVGLALISLSAGGHAASAPHPVLGILQSVGSGLGYAGSTLVSRRLHGIAGPLTLTTVASVVGALTLLPLAATAGLLFSADARTVLSLGYMGIIATALAYGLFFHGLRSTTSEVASVLTLLEPLAATLLAVVLIGERLPAAGWVGGALLLVAVGVLYVAPEEGGADDAAALPAHDAAALPVHEDADALPAHGAVPALATELMTDPGCASAARQATIEG